MRQNTREKFLFTIAMVAAGIGLVLAIIGICLPFYGTHNLFDQRLVLFPSTVSIELVRTFAIISVVLTALYALLTLARFGGFAEFVFAIIAVICAILVAVFSAVLGANINEIVEIWKILFEESSK